MKKKVDAYMLTTMALLIAMMIVLSRVLGIETQLLKLSFTFIPEVIMAALFGPFWTAVGAGVADVIGMTLLAKAPFFIGFTINAMLGGAIYGFFFYKKEITLLNSFLAVLTTTVVINLVLTPLWLSYMYSIPLDSWVLWSQRLLKSAIMLPIQTMMIYVVGRAIPYRRLAKRFV